MKKLNHYLKNKRINSVAILTGVAIYCIFRTTLTHWDSPIFSALKTYEGVFPMFIFGSSSLSTDLLQLSIHNELVFGFLAFLISFLNFKFLHKKSLGLTTLSFPKTRAQIFNSKVILPVALLISSGLIAKTIALYWNYSFYGFSNELIAAYLINILILIQNILLGTALGIFGRVFTTRTLEGVLASAGFILIPKTIYVLIDTLAPLFLHGYLNDYSIINGYLYFFDPIRDYISGHGYHLEIPVTDPISYGRIIHSAFWIIGTIISLYLIKKYFVKNTKYENIGINNKNPIVTIITSAALPLAFATFVYYGNTYGYSTTSAKREEIFIIVTVLALVFGYIINAFITKTLLFKKEKAITLSIIVAIPLIVTIILATGGFGYETRIPTPEKIEKIIIEPSVSITERALYDDNSNGEAISSSYNHYDDFLKADDELGPYLRYEFTNEMDYEKIFALHNSAINNKESQTAEQFIITYEMSDGSYLCRNYNYLSEETVKKLFELWETETIKNTYKDWLLNSEDIRETHKSALDFDMVYNKIPLSKGSKITINSIDSVPTKVEDLTEADFLALKTAIYNDIHALTWEEWFKPEKTYGNIAFFNTYTFKPVRDLSNENYEVDYEYSHHYEDVVGYELNFTVTSEMTNTIKCLEKLGLMDNFKRTRSISKAYLIDTEDCAKIWFSTYANKDKIDNKADFYHSVLFDSTTKTLPITANTFAHPYHNKQYSSITKEVSGEELEALLEKVNTKYYCSTDSNLLFVWTHDSTSDTYVISK